jgi:hypothetical protein
MTASGISAYLSFYNDFDFLREVFASVIDVADEVLIVDGPFEWGIEHLRFLGEYYDETSIPDALREYIGHPKVRYVYRTWRDEAEKRMFGYEQCSNDNILLVDSDEIIHFDEDAVRAFLGGEKSVLAFDCVNLIRRGVAMVGRAGQDPEPRQSSRKNCFFKRSDVSAEQQLDFLWLVNVDQRSPDARLIEQDRSIGLGYHPTLMRGKKGQLTKYAFYTSLYSHRTGNPSPFLRLYGCDTFDELHHHISREDYREAFLHSMYWTIGAGPEWLLERLGVSDPYLDAVAQGWDAHVPSAPLTESAGVPLVSGIRSIGYLPDLGVEHEYEITVQMAGVESVAAGVYELRFGADNRERLSMETLRVEDGRANFRYSTQEADVFARLLVLEPQIPSLQVGRLESVQVRQVGGAA